MAVELCNRLDLCRQDVSAGAASSSLAEEEEEKESWDDLTPTPRSTEDEDLTPDRASLLDCRPDLRVGLAALLLLIPDLRVITGLVAALLLL